MNKRQRKKQFKKIHGNGKADQEASISYFYSHGRFGYVKSVKGGESVKNNHIKKIEVVDE